MIGYAGAMLTVDLTKGVSRKEPLREDLIKDYIGGEGFAARILWEKMPVGTDPLSPDNLLIFATTALTGTDFPSGSRTILCYKSPLTGCYGQNAMGGYFAPALKWAGYDLLIIQGKSERPVYLFIDNDKVEIRDAAGLWGKLGLETDKLIKEEIGDPDIQIIRIGPAGESLNRLACITSGFNRAFGKGGNGAVAGSKNLKAIVVRSREQKIPVHDQRGMAAIAPKVTGKASRGVGALITKSQIHWLSVIFEGTVGIPTRHFQQSAWKDGKKLYDDRIMKKLFTGEEYSCWGCPVGAGKVLSPKKGPYQGHKVDAKVEATWAWGWNLMIDDPDVLCEIFYLCAEYGVDINGAAEWAGWIAECQERGVLTPEDCGGLEVKFGDGESCIKLLKVIFAREGIGDLLAEGPKIAAEKIGKNSEQYVVHSKGSPLEAEDFIADKALLLGTATQEKGGSVNRNWTYPITYAVGLPSLRGTGFLIRRIRPIFQILKTTMNRDFFSIFRDALHPDITGLTRRHDPRKNEAGIAKWLKPYKEAVPGILNTMGGCLILWWFGGMENSRVVEGYKYLTGREISIKEGLKIGEKIINLARAFNAREGFNRSHDTMPRRFLTEAVQGGPNHGVRVENFDAMVDEFYNECGFDLKTGWPTPSKLEELGLKDVADQLYQK